MNNQKVCHIIGGGTINHVRNHLALAAPAYGKTARRLADLCRTQSILTNDLDIGLHLTKMAGGSELETNQDVSDLLDKLIANPTTKIIFLNAAIADFTGEIHGVAGKYAERLQSKTGLPSIDNSGLLAGENPYIANNFPSIKLTPAPKLLKKIREKRKDIFLVGFKTTTGKSEDEQYIAGLNLLKENSCNLVLANDVVTRVNMIITPEEARYHVSTDREEVLRNLVEMAYKRSHLTFTRSTVVSGDSIPWDSELVPSSLRTVVNHCISKNAYKIFRGATVGHFACKLNDNTFLTSIRKSNFNDLHKIGLVKVVTDGPDSVIAYGSKPSVGGQSQRIVFHDHQEYDAIVHFHCPIKQGSLVPVISQREIECGSMACGERTSNGLKQFGNLSAVYLNEHGPNIVFHHSIDPQEVIDFIDKNFDLSQKTGGYVSLGEIVNTPDTLETLMNL